MSYFQSGQILTAAQLNSAFTEKADASSVSGFIDGSAIAANASLVANAITQIQAGTATIVCLGDSITYGQDTTSADKVAPVAPNVQPHSPVPYPLKLQASLNKIYNVSGIAVINNGFSGDTATQGYSRWTSNVGAHLAIVMYGINDAKVTGISVAEYVKSMTAIVKRYNAWGTGVVIMTSTSISQGTADSQVEPYRAAAISVARMFGCPVLHADVIGLNNVQPDIYSDATHFNTAGYTLIGNAVATFIASGGLAMSPTVVASEKTFLLGSEANAITNGTYSNNSGSTTRQQLILTLSAGTSQKVTFPFYLDCDSAYVMLVGRIAIGSAVEFDLDSVRAGATRKSLNAFTTTSYTTQLDNTQAEPTSELFLGKVVGRGWHSVSVSAPTSGSSTHTYPSAFRILPVPQEMCDSNVKQAVPTVFSLFDPQPSYVGGVPAASSTATFTVPAALLGSLMPQTTSYFASSHARLTIRNIVSGTTPADISFTQYLLTRDSTSSYKAVQMSSVGINPIAITSVTGPATNNPGGTVTFNLSRPTAGFMEIKFEASHVPGILDASLF